MYPVTDGGSEDLAGVPPRPRVRLLRAVADFHRRHGDPVRAEAAARNLVALKEELGLRGVDDLVVAARAALAVGDYRAGAERAAAALAEAGRDHRAAYRARFVLAEAHDRLGGHAEADRVFRHHVPDWLPAPDRDFVVVAEVAALRARGRVREPLEVVTALLPTLPRATRHDVRTGAWPAAALELARLQLLVGAVGKALRTSAELVAAHRLHGAGEHPVCGVAIGVHAEALALGVPRRRAEAVRAVEEVRADHARRFGADNPEALDRAVVEGRVLLAAGEPARAAEVLTAARARVGAVLGPDHPLHHRAGHDLARTHLRRWDWPNAVALLEELRPRQVALLGPRHVDCLLTGLDLALCHSLAGRRAEARPLYREVSVGLRHEIGRHREPALRAALARLAAPLPAPALRVVLRLVLGGAA
ncbi:tetratricopeptide repeat protein [Actinosynnema sp. NPDC020468]|uniref:tetratricopeptide repeat protein n=1 Tax=Actinosynnema sp. NPDC020468 TaxID=3154488 RepID=UPI0033C2E08C